MGYYAILDDRAPLYVIAFKGELSDGQFEELLAGLSRIVEFPRRRAFIYDASEAGRTSASQRSQKAQWMKRHEESTRRYTVGVAFVIPSAVVRGVLTAIMWLQPMACPYRLFANRAEALEWCEAQLASPEETPTPR